MFGLCLPAFIYLVLAFIGIIRSLSKGHMRAVLFNILFSGIWVLLLNFLCKKGYNTIAWVILLVPVILRILAASVIYNHNNKK
jgi:hypothetical protein